MLSKESAMLIKKVIAEKVEMLSHNLDCYSADYLNSIPKKGYEQDFYNTKFHLEEYTKAQHDFEIENEL